MTLWYVARAAGIVALVAFTCSTVLGAVSSSGRRGAVPARADRRYLLQMAHRSAAVTGLLALAAHIALLVTDSFVDVSIGGVLVPFTSGYRPLAVAMGTLSAYAIVLVAMSGAARGRLATSARAARAWRSVHVTAYAGWVLSMAHGILAGTDTRTPWGALVYLACGAAVALAVGLRVHAEQQVRSDPLTVARTLERSRS